MGTFDKSFESKIPPDSHPGFNFPYLPDSTPRDALFSKVPVTKDRISHIYSQIQTSSSIRMRTLWRVPREEDWGEGISEELWGGILERVHTSSVYARHRLFQCKVVYRTHWTKARLNKIFGNAEPPYEKCQTSASHCKKNICQTSAISYVFV